LFITEHVGNFKFFLAIFTWTALWLSWNIFGPRQFRFDPAPAFVFWLFLSNMIQIMLMPLILVGQNLQNRHTELRAENDYVVNVKSEKEVQAILLELQRQNEVLRLMSDKLGIDPAQLDPTLNTSIQGSP
jgi:uncharacterized membrane protein